MIEMAGEEKNKNLYDFCCFVQFCTNLQTYIIFPYTLLPREIQAGAKLSLNRQFMDERWSKHRVVTCLDWSPQVLPDDVCVTLLCNTLSSTVPPSCKHKQCVRCCR